MSSYWVIRFLFIRFDLFTLDIQHRIVLCLSFQKYFFFKWNALYDTKIKLFNQRIGENVTCITILLFFYPFAFKIKENSKWWKVKYSWKYTEYSNFEKYWKTYNFGGQFRVSYHRARWKCISRVSLPFTWKYLDIWDSWEYVIQLLMFLDLFPMKKVTSKMWTIDNIVIFSSTKPYTAKYYLLLIFHSIQHFFFNFPCNFHIWVSILKMYVFCDYNKSSFLAWKRYLFYQLCVYLSWFKKIS